MSSYAPPAYVVNIYNPAYFATSSGGLSLATATSLFLNKNTADTATALETFSGGIKTNTVDTTGNVAMYIGQSAYKIYYSSTNVVNEFDGTIKAQGLITANGGMQIGYIDAINSTTAVTIAGSVGNSVSIGSASTVTTNTIGNTAAATVTTINNPVLKMNYTTAPTLTSANIGFTSYSSLTQTVSSNTITDIVNSGSLPVGTWLLTGNITFPATATAGLNRFWINTTSATDSSAKGITQVLSSSSQTLYTTTAIFAITSSSTFYLSVYDVASGFTSGTLTWLRIA